MISFIVHFIRQHSLIILCCVITAIIWPNLRTNFINEKDQVPAPEIQLKTDKLLFTPDELAKYNGIQNEKLFLSILGSVYDVTKGAKHYGTEGTYNYFVGKDASVAFITGEFEKTADDDDDDVLKKLSAQEIYSIHQWKQFYEKDYKFVGLLIGRYYNSDGSQTEYMDRVEIQVARAIKEKERQENLRSQYPPCNIEWRAETGTRVWCTEQSGGIDREWTGVPRKFFEAAKSDFRCACVPDDKLNDGRLKEYDNCDQNETTCFYTV